MLNQRCALATGIALALSSMATMAQGPTTTTPAPSTPESSELVQTSAPASVETAAWVPTTSGPMSALTAPLTPPGRLTLQPIGLTTFRRGIHDDDGRLSAVAVGASFTTQVFVEAGVLDWAAVGAQGQVSADRGGIEPNDTLLFGRFAWSDGVDTPHRLATFIVQLTLPTGDVDEGAGDGAWVGTVGPSFTLYRRPFVWHLDALVSLALPDDAGQRVRPQASWALAVEVPLPFVGDRLAGLLELTGRHQQSPFDDVLAPTAGPPEHEIVIGVGVEIIASDELQALLGWQRTLLGRNVDAVDSFVVTLVPLL